MKKTNTKNVSLAKKNSAIADGMKRYHEEKRQREELYKQIQESLQQRFASISAFRDAYKTQFVNLTPSQIRAVLDSTKTGLLQQWSDFADYMIQTDAHLQGVINSRTHAISGRNIIIQPSDNTDEAKASASFIREQITNIPAFDRFVRQMLMAEFKGASMAEIVWRRNEDKDIFEVEEIEPISLRKIKIRLMPITKDGDVVLTDTTTGYGRFKYSYYNYGDTHTAEGIDVFDLYPGKFIIHSPGDQELLHDRGILKAAAFIWFFKQAALAYYVSASEKYASPVTYGKVPKSTPEETRLNLAENLNNLANDAAAVFDEDVIIETINVANSGGSAIWGQLLSMINAEISKLILGGTLSIEASSTGANRALGEVHERTRIDLQVADASALAETIKYQLIKPMLENNLHLFGGKMPPLPKITFDIITRDYEAISQMHVDAGIITVNELRESVGLPAWSVDMGGDKIVKLLSTDPMQELGLDITNAGAIDNATTVYNGKKKLVDDLELKNKEEEPSDLEIAEVYTSSTDKPTELILYIEKEGSEYVVKSEEGKPMGSYKTIQEAKQRLAEIEMHKHMENKQ